MKTNSRNLALLVILSLTLLGYIQPKESRSKSLHHVLLFQWTENVDTDKKSEVLDLFEGLPAKVNGLETFENVDITASSGNFDNVLIFKFDSEAALEAYEEHPDHLRVKELAPSLLQGFQSFDYWK